MQNRKKIISNLFYQSLYQIVLVIIPIVTVPIISRSLMPSGVGIYNYTLSIVNYFILAASFGLSNYAIREISIVKDSKYKLSQKFFEIELFNCIIAFFVILVYFISISFFKYKNVFFAQSLQLIAVIFDISWFFQGIEDFKKISVLNVIIKLISFILIILFVKKPGDLFKYTWIVSLSVLLSTIIFWPFLKRKIVFVKISLKNVFKHLLPSANFFLLKISSTLFVNFNKTLLGAISTISQVGFFSNALTMVVMTSSIINTTNIVLLPRMSFLESESKVTEMMIILKKSIHIQLFLTIAISFGIVAITPKMILWFFGAKYIFITHLMPLLAPIVIFQNLHQSIANQYLVPKNEMISYNLTMIFSTFINIVLGIALIPRYGSYGASIAFLSGQMVLSAMRLFVLINKSSFRLNIILIIKFVISAIIMYVVIVKSTVNLASTIVTTIIQIIIGIFVYVIMNIILNFKLFRKFIKRKE